MLARRVFMLAVVFLSASLCVLASARPARAADPADQAAINDAIKWGVKYLKAEQRVTGCWTDDAKGDPKGTWAIAYTSLVGLTLIECGDPSDTAIQTAVKRAANVVRSAANDLDSTYELALAILFLDRMKDSKDPRDKPIIHMLASRLIAAQMPSGGWGYKTHKVTAADSTLLINALKKMTPPAKPKDGAPPFDFEKQRKAAVATLPPDLKRIAALADLDPQLPKDAVEKRHDLYDATTDNSNTHFAMLGLWAARKHDVPTDRVFARVNRRFRNTQGGGGTWSYDYVRTGADGGPQHACIALLGLAIGHVVAPEPGVKPEVDPIIVKAFVALSKTVGEPVGDTRNRPKIKDVGGLYFMWAMERIAVLYDIQKFGKKDWYLWGAEILIANRSANGSWEDGGIIGTNSPIVNTCLALLFLKRANLTPDLSKLLVLNPTELTAKVDDKIAPKPPEPPPPSPKVVEPEPIAIAPMPHAYEPKKEPPAPAPVVQAPVMPESTPEPAKKKGPWLWVVLGTLFAGVIGGGLAFLVVAKRRKKDEEEESGGEKKKKKKGKKAAKAEAADEDADADDEKAEKKKAQKDDKPTKKKVKAEVEEDSE